MILYCSQPFDFSIFLLKDGLAEKHKSIWDCRYHHFFLAIRCIKLLETGMSGSVWSIITNITTKADVDQVKKVNHTKYDILDSIKDTPNTKQLHAALTIPWP